MKNVIVITMIMALMATAAFAGIHPDQFRSLDKVTPHKIGPTSYKVGNLDCSGAVEVALDNIYFGDNTGQPNNVTSYSCSFWDESGGEVVYHLFLAEPTMFSASITPNGCDLDLAVLDQCDENDGCLIVVNSGVETLEPVSGDIFFVVDGYAGAECSFSFELVTEELPPPPEPTDFCDSIENVFGTEFSGSTCNGVNAISSLGCEAFTEEGLEYYYEIFMPAASSFTADVTNTADGALWVLDNCSDPVGCLAYADDTLSGDTETIFYENNSGEDIWVYLVVDSYGVGSCGDYTMTFSASGGAVATEGQAFGTLKASFR